MKIFKKINALFALAVVLLVLVVCSPTNIFARLTGQTTQRDQWCTGVSGAEVCVDSSGNFIPTTDDDTDLGTSALQWKDVYIDGTLYVDAISNSGALTGTTLNATGAVTFDSTLDVDGNVVMGASLYRSTFTAASGNLDLTGAFTTDSTIDAAGNVTIGAMLYRSTFTAASGNAAIGGTLTSAGTITATTGNIKVTAGALQPTIKTKAELGVMTPAVGDVYSCSDCTNTYTLCVGTGAVANGFREIGTATGCGP